jgi:hypothetical protein
MLIRAFEKSASLMLSGAGCSASAKTAQEKKSRKIIPKIVFIQLSSSFFDRKIN